MMQNPIVLESTTSDLRFIVGARIQPSCMMRHCRSHEVCCCDGMDNKRMKQLQLLEIIDEALAILDNVAFLDEKE